MKKTEYREQANVTEDGSIKGAMLPKIDFCLALHHVILLVPHQKHIWSVALSLSCMFEKFFILPWQPLAVKNTANGCGGHHIEGGPSSAFDDKAPPQNCNF